MARRMIVHVGTVKTGTTFLQTLLWNNRDVLRRHGILFPGNERADHLYASRAIRNAPSAHSGAPRARAAWDRIRQEILAFDGTAVFSHESLALASAEQAESVLRTFAPAETHVVVTARDCVRTLPGLWQEHVKFASVDPLADFGSTAAENLQNLWSWRSLDTAAVLARWGRTLPRNCVHVITVPSSEGPRSLLWERFAGLLGVDPQLCDASATLANDSLGVVEVELLRKVNSYLGPRYSQPGVASRWLRGYLAAEVLAPRRGDRFGPDPEQEAFLRKKSVEIVAAIREAGYDVIGDLDDLLPPDGPMQRRHPDDVTAAELADAGAATIARVLDDLRTVTLERNGLLARVERAEAELDRSRQHRLRAGLRDMLHRAARRNPRLARAVQRIRRAG